LKGKSAGLKEITESHQMANEFHEVFYELGVSERWNLPLQIPERDVQALSEDVSRIPTISRKEGAAETEEKKRGASLIQDHLSPRNPLLPAMS
jgi:hypothetical protein